MGYYQEIVDLLQHPLLVGTASICSILSGLIVIIPGLRMYFLRNRAVLKGLFGFFTLVMPPYVFIRWAIAFYIRNAESTAGIIDGTALLSGTCGLIWGILWFGYLLPRIRRVGNTR